VLRHENAVLQEKSRALRAQIAAAAAVEEDLRITANERDALRGQQPVAAARSGIGRAAAARLQKVQGSRSGRLRPRQSMAAPVPRHRSCRWDAAVILHPFCCGSIISCVPRYSE